jgi:hypothetical protein
MLNKSVKLIAKNKQKMEILKKIKYLNLKKI